MHERLVAVEQTVSPGQQIALQPTLALVLAKHFKHAPGGGEKLVVSSGGRVPLAIGDFKQRFQPVGERLVRTKDAEVALFTVQFHHLAEEAPEHTGVADAAHAGRGHLDRIVTEIWHLQIAQ